MKTVIQKYISYAIRYAIILLLSNNANVCLAARPAPARSARRRATAAQRAQVRRRTVQPKAVGRTSKPALTRTSRPARTSKPTKPVQQLSARQKKLITSARQTRMQTSKPVIAQQSRTSKRPITKKPTQARRAIQSKKNTKATRTQQPTQAFQTTSELHGLRITQLRSIPQTGATCGAWATANAEIILNVLNGPDQTLNVQNQLLNHAKNKFDQFIRAINDIRSYERSGQSLHDGEIRYLIGQPVDWDHRRPCNLFTAKEQVSVWPDSTKLLLPEGYIGYNEHGEHGWIENFGWEETPHIQLGTPHAFIVGNMQQLDDNRGSYGHWVAVVWNGINELIIVNSTNGNLHHSPVVANVARYVAQQLGQ